MAFPRPAPVGLGVLTLCAFFLGTPAAHSQKDDDPKPVDIVTIDGVELKGTWYPATQGKNAATVLMLHATGEDSKKAEWIGLAKALQGKGYAVLRFDFRGHGDSVTVRPGKPNPNPMQREPGFWDESENMKGVYGGTKRPKSIEFKSFQKTYYKVLANDIAAAKAFLDEKNDAGECNSSNLVLLGAKDGATLGALWLNAEMHRYKLMPKTPKMPFNKPDLSNPEGQAVTGFVALSASGTLGDRQVNLGSMLSKAGRDGKIPMAFFYAEGDSKGKQTAVAAEKTFKNIKDSSKFTGAVKVTNGEKFSGVQLLAKSLGTEKAILEYLENSLKDKNVAAKSRAGNTEMRYVWQWQDNSGKVWQIPARYEKTNQVVFSNYASFLR